jgi:hypothetical protein
MRKDELWYKDKLSHRQAKDPEVIYWHEKAIRLDKAIKEIEKWKSDLINREYVLQLLEGEPR